MRFAPSPTGYLHVGGLRTALFNFLFAKKNNGELILRIEDTDQNRLVKESINNIIEVLHWSGINFDEGPHCKEGKVGPYIQSERLHIYHKHMLSLLKSKKAYACFYSSERMKEIQESTEAKKMAKKIADQGLDPDGADNSLATALQLVTIGRYVTEKWVK